MADLDEQTKTPAALWRGSNAVESKEPEATAHIGNLEVPLPKRQIGIMLDIESLDVGPRSLITQIAMTGFDIDEEEVMEYPFEPFNGFVPFQPQLDFITPRTISAKTIAWWMRQSDEARANFEQNTIDDMHSLRVLMQSFVDQFNQLAGIPNSEYIVVSRGPQFDCVNVESLLNDLGMQAPWKYDTVWDLRTMMRMADLKSSEVEKHPKHIDHDARWDCDFQIRCFFAAKRNLRRGE